MGLGMVCVFISRNGEILRYGALDRNFSSGIKLV